MIVMTGFDADHYMTGEDDDDKWLSWSMTMVDSDAHDSDTWAIQYQLLHW